LDQKYIAQDDFDRIYCQADVVARMDSGFIKYLQSQLNRPKKLDQLKEPKKEGG